MKRLKLSLLLAVATAGCSSYVIKSPDGFDAEPVTVSGSLRHLKLGDYQVADVRRSWTKGTGVQISIAKSDRREQTYLFKLGRDTAHVADGRCVFSASEKSFGLGSGWSLTAEEGADLSCAIGARGEAWRLELQTVSDDVLTGTLTGPGAYLYDIKGVGLASFAATKGPVAGFHIFEAGRMLALVQIVSERRVLYARGLDAAQQQHLAPAIAALMLLDETIRDFD